MNRAMIIGRSTREVELRYTQGGIAVAQVNVAVDRNMSKEKKAEAERQNLPTADFINIVAWRGTAEYLANHLGKGKLVAIEGRIQTGKYEKDGRTIYTTEILADNVKVLEWKDKENNNEPNTNIPNGFSPTDNDDIPF